MRIVNLVVGCADRRGMFMHIKTILCRVLPLHIAVAVVVDMRNKKIKKMKTNHKVDARATTTPEQRPTLRALHTSIVYDAMLHTRCTLNLR